MIIIIRLGAAFFYVNAYIFAAEVLQARDPICHTGILHIPDEKASIFCSGIARVNCSKEILKSIYKSVNIFHFGEFRWCYVGEFVVTKRPG